MKERQFKLFRALAILAFLALVVALIYSAIWDVIYNPKFLSPKP